METKFFKTCKTEAELKDLGFKLKDLLDLDHPENKDLRVEVESEYNSLLNSLKASENNSSTESKETSQDEILEKLIPLNLEIELCGKWIWVRGDTKPHKDVLKELKLRFSPGKKCWYWRQNRYRSINSQPMNMEQIRALHGSVSI